MTAARQQDLRRIEAEVGRLLRRVKRVVAERARGVHPDLHPTSYLALDHLCVSGPARAADLVEVFGADKGAVSRQVQQLVELGLVERRPDPDDRRASLLAPTAEGQERVAAVRRRRSALFDDRLAGWTDEDLGAFAALLGRYNATLDGQDDETG